MELGSYRERWCDHTRHYRLQVDGINIPVSVSNIRIRLGDVVVGDADGALVIPRDIEFKVLQLAQEIEEAEDGIRKAVASGMKLVEARKKFRYHDLQHKQD